MVFDNSKLKGRIVEKFGTQSALAEKLGVTPVTLGFKINGRRSFSSDDIFELCDLLDITYKEIGEYFFKKKVQKKRTK